MWHSKITLCAQAMHQGHVIAYPTEAVWGLGCDPFNRHAVEEILNLKNRHWSKGLILVAGDIAHFRFLLHDLAPAEMQKLEQTWPGHVTWLVPHRNRVPQWVCGEHSTIALRVSTHSVIAALCNTFGGAIVSTSANPQGLTPATTGFGARKYFRGYDVKFSPGVVGKQKKPSKIIDLATGRSIR